MSFVEDLKQAKAIKEKFEPLYFCLECSSHVELTVLTVRCNHCGAEVNFEKYSELYWYSDNALRYGYQYRKYYQKQQEKGFLGEIKPSLAELPEVYKYVSLAIVSGIIGGASWDLTKHAIKNIIAHFEAAPSEYNKDKIDPTIDMEAIETIAHSLQDFKDGLNPKENSVDALLLEEMYADGVTENPEEADKLWKLQFSADRKSPKNDKKAKKIQSKLMQKIFREKMSVPVSLPVDRVWSKLKR